ncbi:MAG: hypothetical protein ACLFQ0_14255 [Cyclobacteriaceae bacterium]
MQFFLGLQDYSPEPVFSPSLFVEIRKKLGEDTFYEFNELLINTSHPELKDKKPDNPAEASARRGKRFAARLKIDATVAVMPDRDQYIRYPNDLSLVNEARVKTEQIIDLFFEALRDELEIKPRTYREVAHQRYLQEAKKRKKTAWQKCSATAAER